MEKYKPVGEIKEIRTLRVSASGRGLYLYLPKSLCEQYDIIAGDRIKVQLKEHYKRDWGAEAE